MNAYLVWPLLDIHIKPDRIFSCEVRKLEFFCLEMQKNISNLEVVWANNPSYSMKFVNDQITKTTKQAYYYPLNNRPVKLSKPGETFSVICTKNFIFLWTHAQMVDVNMSDPSYSWNFRWFLNTITPIQYALGYVDG